MDEIERALVRARRLGYLDDAAFARALAARRARTRAGRAAAGGTDRRAVAARLLRRGFPGDVVREAVGRDVEPLPEVE